MGIFIFRTFFILTISTAGYYLAPFGLPSYGGALTGFLLGLLMVFLESRIRKTQFRIIWSSTIGTFLGVILGWFLGAIYKRVPSEETSAVFIQVFFLLIMPYIGFMVGMRRPEWLSPSHLFRFIKEKSIGRSFKILDTSVIIDGRISDICNTAFIEGTLIVPQFVLKELQTVADSSDGVKRQRGRRGLDVLDHLQRSSQVHVMISEVDFPDIQDVDSKLLELAKQMDGKVVTNDFNLNKVAQLHGIPVMNINELANALKPVVLPGETI